MEQTIGEKRVRLDFNPSTKNEIYEVKKEFANIIDILESFKIKGEDILKVKDTDKAFITNRTINIAQDSIEQAAMWTVKALTS